MPKFAAIILLILVSFGARAQTWELGASAGAAGYIGDLNPTNPVQISGASFAGYVKRNFNGYFSVKLNYTFATVAAADSMSSNQQFRDRNLSFSSHIKELALIGEFNFMNYIPGVSHNRYTPYLFVGVGVLGFNPQATYNGQVYDLQPLQTEGEKPYARRVLTIPYGAGFKYNIAGSWTVALNAGYRQPGTDYLDDVSGVYPDPSKLPGNLSRALSDRSGERTGIYIGAPGTQRGDGKAHDSYFFFQFTLSFTFITQKCYFEQ